MNRTRIWVLFISCLALGGVPSFVMGQTANTGLEQQLRAQYRLTRVGGNGVVVGESGSVLLIQQDGITALPAPGEYPCNTYKPGGRIKSSTMCAVNYGPSKDRQVPLQVGGQVYLTAIQFKPSEIVFKLQSAANNEAPYRASVSFQFSKGFQDSMKLKEVQDTISQVLAPDASSPVQEPEQKQVSPAPTATSVTLNLPATYVSAQAPTDQLQLNANNSFSLQEGGQAYHGNFTVTGNSLDLTISESNTKTTATVEGNKLTDSSGQVWTLREQSAGSPTVGTVLKNEDIIKMAHARFDDGIIIAKINGSQCQFDTSVDALIGLQKAGVSSAVIKAMVGAGK